MPDWKALRRRAYQQHLQLRAYLPLDAPLLPSADSLLQAAEAATGLMRTAMPPDDALLAGAHAVLDRDVEGIWYASGPSVSRPRQRFAQAHEFAHFWLHPEVGHDACLAADTPNAFAPPSFRLPNSQLAEGYSHKERREAEANLFAAELLLPGPVLRRVFLEHAWPASRIATHSGLSLSCVLSQLATALLTGSRIQDSGFGGQKTEDERRKTEVDKPESRILNPETYSKHPTPYSLLPTPSLDASQHAAARIEPGPVLVDAGPGTGKTRTLIARILFLLTERNVPPENILALTFSNKAAEEMHTRLRSEVGDLADRVWIGTFHAFGRELLRKEGHHIGLSRSPELLDMPDAIQLLVNHVDRLRLHRLEYLSQPMLPFPDILDCISRAKDELKSPQDYALIAQQQLDKSLQCVKKAEAEKQREIGEKSLEVAQVYGIYQELLQEEGKLDFGDLLMRSVELLDAYPDVRARWQAQYPHILADEYQDINRASAQLVQRLAGAGQGLWAVGDMRQAIYRFRGASSANVRDFEQDFPGGQRVQLERNYRSRPPLVAMFGAYAGRMTGTTATFSDWQPQRAEETLTEKTTSHEPRATSHEAAHRTHETAAGESTLHSPLSTTHYSNLPVVTLAVTDDEDGQADGLAAQIRQWETAGVTRRDQVILCHTHRQASRLSELLGARGIETQHLSGLFDRDEIKDLLALLSLACEPEGTTLPRVARFPEYAIPEADVLTLLRAAHEQRKIFPGALTLAQNLPDISEAGRAGSARLWRHITPYLSHGTAWALLSGYLFETSDYLRPLLTDDSVAARQKLLAIHELLVVALRLAKRFEVEEYPQAEFMKYLRFLLACGQEKAIRVAGDDAELDGVRLLTVHKSKGLEFPVVYLPNLVKDQFPPGKVGRMVYPPAEWTDGVEPDGSESPPGQEGSEAECLFFVALSRARDALILSRPLTWNGKPVDPSPLLTECETALNACGAMRITWPSTSEVSTVPSVNGIDDGIQKTEEAGSIDDVVTFSVAAAMPVEGAKAKGAEESGQTDEAQSKEIGQEPARKALTITAPAAEQYRRCPRQYYYQRVLKLPTRNDAPYLVFHSSLRETVAWLQSERTEGRAPTLDEATEKMQTAWDGHHNAPHNAHARVLQARARGLLANAVQVVQTASEQPSPLELTAQLEHGAVQVHVDHAEATPDGGLRLVDYKTGRDDKKDHTDIRLALVRHAARQQSDRPVLIVLGYLENGEQKEVEEKPRYEPDRVAKYDEALKGIREGRFAPNRSQECARCPFFLICPL